MNDLRRLRMEEFDASRDWGDATKVSFRRIKKATHPRRFIQRTAVAQHDALPPAQGGQRVAAQQV